MSNTTIILLVLVVLLVFGLPIYPYNRGPEAPYNYGYYPVGIIVLIIILLLLFGGWRL